MRYDGSGAGERRASSCSAASCSVCTKCADTISALIGTDVESVQSRRCGVVRPPPFAHEHSTLTHVHTLPLHLTLTIVLIVTSTLTSSVLPSHFLSLSLSRSLCVYVCMCACDELCRMRGPVLPRPRAGPERPLLCRMCRPCGCLAYTCFGPRVCLPPPSRTACLPASPCAPPRPPHPAAIPHVHRPPLPHP